MRRGRRHESGKSTKSIAWTDRYLPHLLIRDPPLPSKEISNFRVLIATVIKNWPTPSIAPAGPGRDAPTWADSAQPSRLRAVIAPNSSALSARGVSLDAC